MEGGGAREGGSFWSGRHEHDEASLVWSRLCLGLEVLLSISTPSRLSALGSKLKRFLLQLYGVCRFSSSLSSPSSVFKVTSAVLEENAHHLPGFLLYSSIVWRAVTPLIQVRNYLFVL
jgi:hypothetical protein